MQVEESNVVIVTRSDEEEDLLRFLDVALVTADITHALLTVAHVVRCTRRLAPLEMTQVGEAFMRARFSLLLVEEKLVLALLLVLT